MSAPASSSVDPSAPHPEDASFARYGAAARRLDDLIDPLGGPPRGDRAAVRQRAEHRLDRLRRFLRALGNPHHAYPVVHVAGTSGKGSTASTIAAILRAGGYKVGLHTSPYLQVATEKVDIDGELIAAEAFADAVERTLAEADRWCRDAGETRLSYGELWVALAARCFAEAGTDIAVVEVGAGGRFDLTNVVRPAVAVVTTVGLDHQATLGDTIAEIAWHKAGIIKPGAAAVTGVVDPTALTVIVAEAARAGVPLTRIAEGASFEIIDHHPATGTTWRDLTEPAGPTQTFSTATAGRVQAANAAVAVAAVNALAPRGFPVSANALAAGIAAARMPGRMEHLKTDGGIAVLLDGAHNPQKLSALIAELGAPRPVILLALLDGKDRDAILPLVAPHAAAMVTTTPAVTGKQGADPQQLASAIRRLGYTGPTIAVPEPSAALDAALAQAATLGTSLVVTGSLYLVGALRELWYPSAAIVAQQTPWPTR